MSGSRRWSRIEVKSADLSTPGKVAYALAIFPLPVVHRATIRALLPAGTTRRKQQQQEASRLVRAMTGAGDGGKKKATNRITERFQCCLRDMDRDGWIRRGQEFIQIVDRQALLDKVSREIDRLIEDGYAVDHVNLRFQSAMDAISESIKFETRPRVAEIRRQELIQLQRLMESGRGSNWSGRGSVRLIPKGPTL